MKNFLPCIFILSILTCMNSLPAQPIHVILWPSSPPGSIPNPSFVQDTVYTETGLPRVRHVTEPDIEIYLPPGREGTVPAVIICPGGGYVRLAMGHEGTEVAEWLNQIGAAGIVLKYRLPSDTIMKNKSIGPLQDMLQAIRIVRRRSAEWRIDPGRIGVMGFSAGGHLAGSASTLYKLPTDDTTSARPDFSILIYGALSMESGPAHGGSREKLLGEDPDPALVKMFSAEENVTAETPPAFIVHSENDPSVPVASSIAYFTALKKCAVPAELHIYERGGHGYGLAKKGGTESGWPEACRRWMVERGILRIRN